ncbi:MAG: NAD(P)-dependent oxidoreductase [Eubacteriales bacterium]|nr:NAD(P)-dependent oxidoreductase [Eubacteriales bacterium]
MSYCPFFIELENQAVIIVGGTDAAYQKCRELVAHGALVTLWAAEFVEDLRLLKEEQSDNISILKAELTPDMAEQIFKGKNAPLLLVLAGQDAEYNAELEKIAEANKVLVNNLSNPESRLNFSANLKRAEISFAVHAAKAPQLSSAVAQRLHELFPAHWAQAYERFMALSQSEQLALMKPAERVSELRKLASALVQADGNIEDALGLLAGALEITESE